MLSISIIKGKRGASVALEAVGQSDRAVSTGRRSHAIFVQLQCEIMLGQLAPGQTLLEMELARRFGSSQGSVREALMQLQEEGLVNRMPHRGTQVADCRGDDARELIRIRHDIECRAVGRIVERGEKELVPALEAELEAMRAAARAGDEYLLSVHDRRFHARLFASANLPALQAILGRCLIHNHRYKILNSQPNRALMETADRHVTIIDALASGDVGAARAALSHHIATIVDFGPKIIEGEG